MQRRRYAFKVPYAPPQESPGQRELATVREIVHGFLRADHPEEAFQFALDRVSPVVGASLASVYVLDGESELMRLVAAHNWPEQHRPWLAAMRVRVGFGPSGEAASERRVIEVPDVFIDAELEDWQEVARELGFTALVSLPLQTASRVLGAVTFYFREWGTLTAEKRDLLRLVADHMAATADKAVLLDQLRRANAALTEAHGDIERQFTATSDATRERDELVAGVSGSLQGPLDVIRALLKSQTNEAAERALGVVEETLEFAALKAGTLAVSVEDFDPRTPLREAVGATRHAPPDVHLIAEEPVHGLPMVRSDRLRVSRILATLIANALRFTESGEVRAGISCTATTVEYRVHDTGRGIDPSALASLFDETRVTEGGPTRISSLGVCRGIARALGGDLEGGSEPGRGSSFTLRLPLEYLP